MTQTIIESVGHGKIVVNHTAGHTNCKVDSVEHESVKQYIDVNYIWSRLFDMLRHYERKLGALYVDGELFTC